MNALKFLPSKNQPAHEFNEPRDFCFPTPRPWEFAESNVVMAGYRCGERCQERPVIGLLQGSGDSLITILYLPSSPADVIWPDPMQLKKMALKLALKILISDLEPDGTGPMQNV